MKNLLEKLIPSFLKALDRHFLLQHRLLWITKVHYVLFYVGIAFLLSMAYISWHPTPYNLPKAEFLILGSCFVMLVPFGFWIFKQISFSIENNYGKRFPFLNQMRFGLYLICFMAFLSMPFGTTFMTQHEIANYVDDATFDADRELLNLYNPFLLTKSEIDNQTHHIEHNVKQSFLFEQGYTDENYYEHLESYNYPKSLLDKVETEKDNLCHYYNDNALSYYSYYTDSKRVYEENRFDCEELQPTLNKKSNHKAFITKYIALFNQYGGNIKMSAEEIIQIRQNLGRNVINMNEYIPNLSYQKDKVRKNLSRISNAKYSWKNTSEEHSVQIFSVYFFLAFFASLLLSMYTMVRTKDFIVAVISFIGLGMVTGFTSVMINEFIGRFGTHSESTFFVLVLGLYIFATFQGLRIFTAKHFSMFKTICLILSTFATPFVVIWLQVLGESMTEGYAYHDDMYYLGLIWTGIVVFSVLIEPAFRRLFLKIQSLPKA